MTTPQDQFAAWAAKNGLLFVRENDTLFFVLWFGAGCTVEFTTERFTPTAISARSAHAPYLRTDSLLEARRFCIRELELSL